MESEIKETGCCPIFDQTKWDNQVIEWNDKKFIKRNVFTLFYMPINFGSVITKMFNNITLSSGICEDNLTLAYHKNPWKMELYLAVDREIPDEENVTLSGKYFVRSYDGPFGKTGSFMKEFENEAKIKGHNLEKIYLWYAYCPKCAKVYGHNFINIFGKIS